MFSRWIFLAIPVLVVACAAGTEADSSGNAFSGIRCLKNQTHKCLCSILEEGQQTCKDDNTYTKCDCGKGKPGATTPGNQSGAPPSPNQSTTDNPPGAIGDGDNSECPGQVITVTKGGQPVVIGGTTAGSMDKLRASCLDSPGPERVFAVHPSGAGTLRVDAAFASGFNAIVEVRKDACNDPSQHVMCEDTLSNPVTRLIEVEDGSTYYVIIDGDAVDSAGPFTVHLELS